MNWPLILILYGIFVFVTGWMVGKSISNREKAYYVALEEYIVKQSCECGGLGSCIVCEVQADYEEDSHQNQ